MQIVLQYDLVKEKPELQCVSDEDLETFREEHGFTALYCSFSSIMQ